MKFIRKTKFGIPSALIVICALAAYFFLPPAIKTEAGCNGSDGEQHTVTVTKGVEPPNDDSTMVPEIGRKYTANDTKGSWHCSCPGNNTPQDINIGEYPYAAPGKYEGTWDYSQSCNGCDAEAITEFDFTVVGVSYIYSGNTTLKVGQSSTFSIISTPIQDGAPAGPYITASYNYSFDDLQVQKRYKPESGDTWGSWTNASVSSATMSVSEGTPGFYELRARNGDDDGYSNISYEVVKVSIDSKDWQTPSISPKICLNAQSEYNKAKFTAKVEGPGSATISVVSGNVTVDPTSVGEGETEITVEGTGARLLKIVRFRKLFFSHLLRKHFECFSTL